MATANCIRSDHNWMQDFADIYHTVLIEKTNPVVMEWSMVGSDRINCFIVACYVVFVNYVGPYMMKDRKPFDLRWLMVPYNAVLVVFNFYIFFEFAKIRWLGEIEDSCTTLEIIHTPNTFRLAEVTWYFYISKYVELTDTIFFILRKKDRQLSRLHLVHHSSVPLIVWGMLRSEPGGYNSFFPLANSFVHVIMYAYYGVSALGEEVTIHLRFKKYITMTQMLQFILVLYYIFSRPFYGCHPTALSFGLTTFIAGGFFMLFSNFYWNEYILRREAYKAKMANGKLKDEVNGADVSGNKKLK